MSLMSTASLKSLAGVLDVGMHDMSACAMCVCLCVCLCLCVRAQHRLLSRLPEYIMALFYVTPLLTLARCNLQVVA